MKIRNFIIRDAKACKGGRHQDKRNKRCRTRADQKRRALRDQ